MYIKKVTPEVYDAVLIRDMGQWCDWMRDQGWSPADQVVWLKSHPLCLAPVIDLSELGNCSGRSTLDHVKDQPRMSKRATSDEQHLVTLCEGHTEEGRRGGHQWNTVKANREAVRGYLARIYGAKD